MSKTIIGTRINQSIINELNERKKVFSRKEGGSKYTISPEDITKHFQKVVNMRLISLNKSTRNNKLISGTDVILYNNYDKSFEELYPEETPYGEQNYKKHIPTINSANVQMYGKFGAVKKTSIEFTCGNIEQLTYMFDLYQTPGGICIFEFGWGDTFKSSKLNQTAINGLKNQSYNEILKDYNYFDRAYTSSGRYGIILGIVTNFSQSINENGGFTASLEMTSLGDNIFKMNMKTENGSNFNFEALKGMLEKKYILSNTDDKQSSSTIIKYLKVKDLFDNINLLLKENGVNSIIDYTPLNDIKINGEIITNDGISYKIVDESLNIRLLSKKPSLFINKLLNEIMENKKRTYKSVVFAGNLYSEDNLLKYYIIDDYDYSKDTDESLSNSLISDSLIQNSINESKTLEEFIDIILSTINQCLMGFVKLSMKSLDENDIVIINENKLNYSEIKNNTTKFDIQTYDNIFKSSNYSSNLTDMLKAHALFNLKKGYKINVIGNDESLKASYWEMLGENKKLIFEKIKGIEHDLNFLYEPKSVSLYDSYFNYVYSENKSLDRIFNIPLTLTTDGITGMTYGNAFTLNYLMDIYEKQKVFPCFFITKINHNLTDSNWETEIVGQFLPLKK